MKRRTITQPPSLALSLLTWLLIWPVAPASAAEPAATALPTKGLVASGSIRSIDTSSAAMTVNPVGRIKSDGIGLFGFTSSATIENIGLTDPVLNWTGDSWAAGTLVGMNLAGSVRNSFANSVTVDAVFQSPDSPRQGIVAGLVAFGQDTLFDNCHIPNAKNTVIHFEQVDNARRVFEDDRYQESPNAIGDDTDPPRLYGISGKRGLNGSRAGCASGTTASLLSKAACLKMAAQSSAAPADQGEEVKGNP